MADYLSTREVARYLKLNQKKIYAMVAAGELPAARICGKWLFPRHLIDEWIERHTVHPAAGVMDALIDEMVVLQGSDDWLLWRVLEQLHALGEPPVPTAVVGSVCGLKAVAAHRAHVASCHVELAEVQRHAGAPAYLVDLYAREQGLLYDRSRTGRIADLRAVARRRLRFAERQEGSGTSLLVRRLLGDAGVEATWRPVGPYTSHLAVALAIRTGDADVGVGARIAADLTGLAFTPLATEPFTLLVPASLAAHPRLARFLELTLDGIHGEAKRRPAGYGFSATGQLRPVVAPAPKDNRR